MSEPLFNSIDAHAADERRAGRWDVSSVLIKAKHEIEDLRANLAAAEARIEEQDAQLRRGVAHAQERVALVAATHGLEEQVTSLESERNELNRKLAAAEAERDEAMEAAHTLYKHAFQEYLRVEVVSDWNSRWPWLAESEGGE